ncbi:MAG: DUF3795 domain-containing protein [Bacillota bacterium]
MAEDYQVILGELAPCGLDCSRCARYGGGEIKKLAAELIKRLEGFEKAAAKIGDFVPALKGYPQFREILNFFTQADCSGCRYGEAPFPLCAAKTCFKEKGVDFCFQCGEYPCERNRFHPELHDHWRHSNDRMKEIGVEAYHQEQKKKPRY